MMMHLSVRLTLRQLVRQQQAQPVQRRAHQQQQQQQGQGHGSRHKMQISCRDAQLSSRRLQLRPHPVRAAAVLDSNTIWYHSHGCSSSSSSSSSWRSSKL
jgi:hypothetical protein